MRKCKNIFLIILLFISIGFAILSSNLSMGSNIAISNASFDVHFEDAVIYQTNVDGVSNPTINSERDTVTMNVELDKPGDYVQVGFYVVNAGTIDAQLNEIIATTLTNEEKKYLSYSYQYLTSEALNTGDLLRVGQKRRVIVNYQYKYDLTDFIDFDSKSLSLSLKYIQPNNYDDKVWTYNFENTYQTFKAPHTGSYKVELWGAQGGGRIIAKDCGGLGAYTMGTLVLNKNDIIYVYVGENGKTTFFDSVKTSFNGGGYCDVPEKQGNYIAVGGSGAGATDIRLVDGDCDNFTSLKSRIMVAAGGGGNGYSTIHAGAGGGLVGYTPSITPNFETYPSGKGGTQTSGGLWDINNSILIPGTFGVGGSSIGAWDGGGSGGAGYFGGSGGKVNSGGGGSSYISGHNGCVAIEESSTENNITFPTKNGVACDDGTTDITCSYHYSGYKFTNTVMIDGQGYKWTTERGSEVVGMPTHDGTGTMTGNSGNGYAEITYLG